MNLRVEQAIRVGVAERAAHSSGPAWTRVWGQRGRKGHLLDAGRWVSALCAD